MHRLIFISAALLLASLTAHAAPKAIEIAIVTDGPWARGQAFIRSIQNETRELLSGEYQVKFRADGPYAGNWTTESVANAFDASLKSADIDIVITAGALSSHQAISRSASNSGLSKPVIAPVIIDAKLQELPRDGKTSGVRNLTYLDRITRLDRDLLLFREIVDFKHLVLVADRLVLESMPGLSARVDDAAKTLDTRISIIAGDTQAVEILDQLPADTDAVLVVPLLRFGDREVEALAAGFITRKLPSFSALGLTEVEAGIFATASPATDLTRIARRVALQVQQILLGVNPEALDVSFPIRQELVINMATARAIEIWPRWSVLAEATLLNEDPPPPERRLTLERAMREAIKVNLDLLAEEYVVARGVADIRRARARLLPQLSIGTTARRIDSDRAQFSSGQQPETLWDANLALQQLLYSSDAWAALGIEKHLQYSRQEDYDSLRLDISLAAANAYLNILRAEALLEIEKENLGLTQANLHRSEVRESVGISGLADVYRWESNEATNRQAVLDAGASVRIARIELNRLLNRPLDERFDTDGARLNDENLIVSDKRIFDYVSDPWSFSIFRDFSARRALKQAPELRALRAGIEAGETTLKASRASLWVPEVAVQGEFRRELQRSGAGKNYPPGASVDDNSWNLGLNASLPLFKGGERYAVIDRAEQDLARLKTQLDGIQQRIEQRLRSALHRTGASYAGINLTATAAAAADANLDIVTDGYSRGAVSIIDLLDAQNASLVSAQAAANARYDFLLDVIEAQRAMGQFDYFMSPAERENYFAEVEAWFDARRDQPAPLDP